MNLLGHADAYLAIPLHYGADLDDLWWSSNGDAIERRDGTTLAGIDEIRVVLEGALAKPPVPPFAFVLNLLHLMKTGAVGFESLRSAFAKTRGAVTRGRNTGLLIAELCRDLPNDGIALTAADVVLALRRLRLFGAHNHSDAATEPPLTRIGFECRIAHRLLSFTDADLVHWFTHGCWPGEGGEKLAKEVESLPARVAKLLSLARRRQRLAGVASLVPFLDAALTLPPRGRPPESLPIGGYSDVTTRGDPERLLPGQFALDPDEFVRRFAARELLYFKREEPHEAMRPERVVVLDQGVRTWGSVRLALSAAAVSLAKVDAKRCDRVRLFLTSTLEPIDFAEVDLHAMADRLEASDLTPNPNAALVEALHEPDSATAPRDVILLTHKRTARDSATYAGGTRRPNDRVFALSVDETGAAELGEWVDGGLVALRAFRVDLDSAEAIKPEGEPSPQLRQRDTGAGEWSGDIEPVPFPFRPGLIAEPLQFGFDADGDWLVIAGRDGILQSLALNGTPPEVLPRSYQDGVVLKQVEAVLGVADGVVVCGRMAIRDAVAHHRITLTSHDVALSSGATEPSPTEQFVAVHYDRTAKRVTLHALGPIAGESRWAAHPDLHCITLRTASGNGCAFDLATLGRFPYTDQPNETLVSRARIAWSRAAKGVPPYEVPVVPDLPASDSALWNSPFLHRVSKLACHLKVAPLNWRSLMPLRDGHPLLAGAEVQRAMLAGDVLAMIYAKMGERRLLLLRGPEGAVLGDLAHPTRSIFTLSSDGRRLARRDVARAVVVSDTADPAKTIATASPAALHDALAVEITNPFRLTITIGGYEHVFRLQDGELVYQSRWEMSDRPGRTKSAVVHMPTAYDTARFPRHETAHVWGWRAVVDRFGQVLLCRGDKGPLVAVFLIRRERAAVWIPGGVFWGDMRLIGGPPTPDAGRKIGQAILAAEGG
jgi:hypothetical protein